MKGMMKDCSLNKRLIMSLFVCGLSFAGASARSRQDLPQVITHEVGAGPVKIENLFPERGLTDPHAMIVDGRLFVGCGRDESWDTQSTWKMDCWEFWSTDDLKTWRYESTLWPTDTYIGDKPNCWAGDFSMKNGIFYWYFSNRNINTGVAVSDRPGGPYRDALGKPLLPADIIPGVPYDPEIVEEDDGKSYVIFSAGKYYIAELGDDMISIAAEPKRLIVQSEDSADQWTADKPAMFKRNGFYYLVWGGKYAMSNTLFGPYVFKGDFTKGGHNSIFQWKGQWYVLQENKDIGLFYRGVSLKPFGFNADGTIKVPEDDADYPHPGRAWTFDYSTMGWRAEKQSTLTWNPAGWIEGNVTGNAVIQSVCWPVCELHQNMRFVIGLKNETSSPKARLSIASVHPSKGLFSHPEVDWKMESETIEFEVLPHDDRFREYVLELKPLENLKSMTKRIRIEPAVGAMSGKWAIDYMSLEGPENNPAIVR